jgi:hypothetical protein
VKLQAALGVCPKNKPFLDPFQFNFIMQVITAPASPPPLTAICPSLLFPEALQVPGQTVAMHLDAPYFWGASRVSVPQWLLVSMVFSGLFQDKFVDQVQVSPSAARCRPPTPPSRAAPCRRLQVVAYLHEWTDDRGGAFVYWKDNSGQMHSVPPSPLSGSSVDGSKTVHAGAPAACVRGVTIIPRCRSGNVPGDGRYAANRQGRKQCGCLPGHPCMPAVWFLVV